MAAELHVGDVGTEIELVLVDEEGDLIDLTGATTLEFTFRKPDATTTTRTAAVVTTGTDGRLEYVTVSGDLDQAGRWDVQAHVVLPLGAWRSEAIRFQVEPNL